MLIHFSHALKPEEYSDTTRDATKRLLPESAIGKNHDGSLKRAQAPVVKYYCKENAAQVVKEYGYAPKSVDHILKEMERNCVSSYHGAVECIQQADYLEGHENVFRDQSLSGSHFAPFGQCLGGMPEKVASNIASIAFTPEHLRLCDLETVHVLRMSKSMVAANARALSALKKVADQF